MSDKLEPNESHRIQPNVTRRQMGVGLLAMAAGGLGFVRRAQAFPPGAQGNFNAVNSVLQEYGVAVTGDQIGGQDLLSFTHFHDGAIIPCVRTTIEGEAQAVHELFDPDQGGIVPCVRVVSEMDGGHIGNIEATHYHPTERGIVPCVRTSIVEDHTVAIHELFDALAGEDPPTVLKIESEMLEGGALGAVDVRIEPPVLTGLRLHFGENTYQLNMINGGLELEQVKLPAP